MVVRNPHEWSIKTSSTLSTFYMPEAILPIDVVAVLNEAKVSFVLVGLHGLAGWMKEPRATQDVDVVVATRHHKKAVQALQKAFAGLETHDLPVVTRLRDPQTQVVFIDVMKPLQQPYREVFHHTETVKVGKHKYRVPCLEMALTMKFAAMTSPYRLDEDKHQDAHDFIRMVKANQGLDERKLVELGCLLYPEGGRDLLEMVDAVRAGRPLRL